MPRAKLNPNQVNEDTLQDADNDTKVQVEASSDEDKIRFSTNGAERMIIDNAGLVGIGTTSPDYTLHVAGDMSVDQYIYHNGDSNTHINFTDDKIVLKAGNISMVKMEEKDSAPHEVTINDGSNNIDFVVKGNGSGAGNPGMKFDADTNRLGINGVGTPDKALHVGGSMKLDGTQPTIFFADGNTEKAEIGINSSDNILIENKTMNKHIVFKVNDQGTVREGLRLDGAVPEVVVNQTSDSLVDFRVESDSNTHMLFVDGSANKIGINNAAPNHELTITGNLSASLNVSASAFYGDGSNLTGIGGGGGGSPAGADSQIQYNNGGSFGAASVLVYDDTNARVGIGLTTPQTTLHIHADSINNGTVTISQADNSGDASQLDLSKARGSGASPSAVQDGDFVGQVRMLAYDGDSYDNFADIYAQATGTVTTTSHPTRVVIRTTQTNATSPTTAVTISENQDMTVAGAVHGKMKHMTHHRYNDGNGTGKEYIPWAGTSEQPSPSWITQGVAPYSGRLAKVWVRSSKSPTMGTTTVGVHTGVDGDTVVSSTATESQVINMTSANTGYVFNFTGTNHFAAGDIIAVSIDPTGAHGNVNVTCVWEYDVTA